MHTQLTPVQYALHLRAVPLLLNSLLGKTVRLEYLGAIHCCHCGRKTKSSYSQGYCYPCMQKLAQCDLCIMSPKSATMRPAPVASLPGVSSSA